MDMITEVLNLLSRIQSDLKNSNPDLAFLAFEEMTDIWASLRKGDYEAAQQLFKEISIGWRPEWYDRQFVLDW